MKTIQSPEGVTLLMENMWLRHKAGINQRHDNIFFVDLPPLTEKEKEEIRRRDAKVQLADDTRDDIFGDKK